VAKDNILYTFPNDPTPEFISRGEGINLYTKSGRKYLDTTSGFTAHAILGWSHPFVISEIKKQLDKITHIDYKIFRDENREELAELMLSRCESNLSTLYFAGNSGGEACEASMKLAYQYFVNLGKPKKSWFISRKQSYHGSSTDALAVGDRPNLDIYKALLPQQRAKIEEHNHFRHRLDGESLEQYASRSAKELEDKILEIGPENVCAFLAETISGGLIGDVPPAPTYWKKIRSVCDKYDVLLICDEVWCGTGTTGKIYCIDYDGITPDFLFFGKTFAAGYGALSALLTTDKVKDVLSNLGDCRVQHSTTHQGHSLATAAALAVQKVIHEDGFLESVSEKGQFLEEYLLSELGSHEFFRNVRGRGLRRSLEYRCENMQDFGLELTEKMREDYNILISGKWHRVCFSPALITSVEQFEFILEKFVKTFKSVASSWNSSKVVQSSWFNKSL